MGIAAGIKLTPAVGGLFLLARKRWWAAVASGVVFAATVGFGYVLLPAESRRYFTVLIGDTGPIGDPAKPDNQSLRGALSRFAGHDLGSGPAVLIAIGVAAVALLAAWWVCRRGDALIALVLAQSFGLFASPISWIHHWVWIVPTLVWLVHGASGATGVYTGRAERRGCARGERSDGGVGASAGSGVRGVQLRGRARLVRGAGVAAHRFGPGLGAGAVPERGRHGGAGRPHPGRGVRPPRWYGRVTRLNDTG
ncbi:glycosyltransferase 87 family protein [Tsukamurella soli]|uniref:glycosyltransferase 87 family protein n=1 Tax=Tsukamurella soli TaxID=644556 RepID=UPI00361F0A1C